MNKGLPATEEVNPRTAGLDELATPQLVEVLAEEHRLAVDAVLAVRDTTAAVVDEIAARMRDGGRLHYVGAGTSGRLGYLDASEMPPTFGTPPELVCAHIAGGIGALIKAVEGAEDDAAAGAAEMDGHVRAGDAVIGISASGGAPYVVGAIERARAIGAYTVGVSNSASSRLGAAAQVAIVLATGAEPLTGSTRLKAGTSQKLLLNTISTAVMVRLGKVHDNLMVDMVATNLKLRDRALRLVVRLTDVDSDRAKALLDQAGNNVKVAVVMAKRGVSAAAARDLLATHHDVLRAVIR